MKNAASGKVWYGLHFYPGVAEYQPAGKDAFRVFLNESTIRSMDPSFEGKPVFVLHVDEVTTNLDQLRREADGWVVESFYNKADGKHWAKFVIVSEAGKRAIRSKMRLSNCYQPTAFGQGGLWNGVSYDKEVTGGEYEHLALVDDPRYEESMVLTPEEFKAYNEEKLLEVERLANAIKQEPRMKFWTRKKIENQVDVEATMVELPKSKREVSISTLVTEADEAQVLKNEMGGSPMAMGHHMVECNGMKMTVDEMKADHSRMKDELESMKAEKAKDPPDEASEDDDASADDEEGEVKAKNGEDEAEEEKSEKAKNEIDAARAKAEAKKIADAEKAERLRNAHKNPPPPAQGRTIEIMEDQLTRGRSRYGSEG